MERKHFYVTLYSNASQELYPDNTQTAFTCQIAQPTDLGSSSDWEVGLCEVNYKPPKRQIINGVVIVFICSVNGLIYCDLIAPGHCDQLSYCRFLVKTLFKYLPAGKKANFKIYILR